MTRKKNYQQSSNPSTSSSHNRLKQLLTAAFILGFFSIYLIDLPPVSSQEKSEQKTASFKSVEPIFEEKCLPCHNQKTRSGGLSMETFEDLMKGGKNGPAIVPGKSVESRMVKMLEGTLAPKMPLADELPAEEIKIIKQWIDAGAPGPTKEVDKEPEKKPDKAEKPTVSVNAAVGSLAFNLDGSLLAAGGYREATLISAKE
jgi:hypothetical protein